MTLPQIKHIALSLIICFASIGIAYVFMEIGYRVYAYYHLKNELIKTANNGIGISGGPHKKFDEHLGGRYLPNVSYKDPSTPWNSWQTNSHGHVSNQEYTKQKPSSEYRIVVIGDSFTAGIMSNVRWTDTLQEKLNANKEWKDNVGGKFIRVINCGLDGIAFVQFDKVLKYDGLDFQPDLVLVNFIADDIKRRPYHISGKTFSTEEERKKAINDFVTQNYMSTLDWYSFYPELLAVTVGKYLNLQPRLRPDEVNQLKERYYSSPQFAYEQCVDTVKNIYSLFPNSIFVVHPQYQELKDHLINQDMTNLRPYLSQVKFLFMINCLPKVNPLTLSRWYNIEHNDLHPSDVGSRVYGEALAEHLLAHVRALKAD